MAAPIRTYVGDGFESVRNTVVYLVLIVVLRK
jgi:hypothetical protein